MVIHAQPYIPHHHHMTQRESHSQNHLCSCRPMERLGQHLPFIWSELHHHTKHQNFCVSYLSHHSLLNTQELRDKLISQITELGKREGRERDRKLKELLTKSFPVIKIKALRPVVMCILKHMSHVEDKYLKILVSYLSDVWGKVERYMYIDTTPSYLRKEFSACFSGYDEIF